MVTDLVAELESTVSTASDTAKKAVSTVAATKAAGVAKDATERAWEATERAWDSTGEARSKAREATAEGVARARDASGPALDRAREATSRTIDQVRDAADDLIHDEPEPERSTFAKVLTFTAVVGAAGAAISWWRRRSERPSDLTDVTPMEPTDDVTFESTAEAVAGWDVPDEVVSGEEPSDTPAADETRTIDGVGASYPNEDAPADAADTAAPEEVIEEADVYDEDPSTDTPTVDGTSKLDD